MPVLSCNPRGSPGKTRPSSFEPGQIRDENSDLRLTFFTHDDFRSCSGNAASTYWGAELIRRSRCSATCAPALGSARSLIRLRRWPFHPEPTSRHRLNHREPMALSLAARRPNCALRSFLGSGEKTRAHTLYGMGGCPHFLHHVCPCRKLFRGKRQLAGLPRAPGFLAGQIPVPSPTGSVSFLSYNAIQRHYGM